MVADAGVMQRRGGGLLRNDGEGKNDEKTTIVDDVLHETGNSATITKDRISSILVHAHTSSTPPAEKTPPSKTTLTTLPPSPSLEPDAVPLALNPPPDSGAFAWTQAVMGHLVIFNTWGLISTFGVFQTHYTSTAASSPGLEPSAVAWIGSTQMLLHFSLGLFSGRALDAGHFHWAVVPGVLLAPLGMFLTSLCTSYTYWQLFLAQGVLTGVGCGLQFSPCISLVATYFARNRSVALAIVSTGSATGGLVYPTVARQLLPRIGFAWTVRCMAFMMLGVGALYAALLRPRLPPRKSGPVVEVAALRELPYALFLLGVFLMGLGQFFAFYYIGTYAIEVVGVSYGTSVNLLLLMNGVGVVGRLVPAYVADRWCGPFNTVVPSGFAAGVLLYAWTGVRTLGGLYAFSVVYGICIAGFMGMFPVALTSLTKDLQKVGVRNGMGFGIIGLGSLIGPPIAGALIQRNGHGDGDAGTRYVSAQVWGASMVIAGSAVLLAARITITGWVVRVRV